ncbi:MAG: ABC-2 type transport system ATP-binding protein [Flavobacteriales bacterium]|jgi:ABC-2 type transport system ATP-binding protein
MLKKNSHLLEVRNLADVQYQPLKSYSGEMKQRVGIAQALLNDPKLLIMNETTVGLDPEERASFRD